MAEQTTNNRLIQGSVTIEIFASKADGKPPMFNIDVIEKDFCLRCNERTEGNMVYLEFEFGRKVEFGGDDNSE